MGTLTLGDMQNYLVRSMASHNANKVNGLLAEVAFRAHLAALGFGQRVTQGGWLLRPIRVPQFGGNVIALLPADFEPNVNYNVGHLAVPTHAQSQIGNHLQQAGIKPFVCSPGVAVTGNATSTMWMAQQIGQPHPVAPLPLNALLAATGFQQRGRRFNWLRYNAPAALIPPAVVPTEFAKECLRVSVQSQVYAEISDIDGVFYGQNQAYPLEIKEKTFAPDAKIGPFFGLDVGPFTKFAFYSSVRNANLDGLYVVREIDDVVQRHLVDWWVITYADIARHASWFPMSGGRTMGGGGSTVIRIPRHAFARLDAARLATL